MRIVATAPLGRDDVELGATVSAKFLGRDLAITATLVGWTDGGRPICEGTLGNEQFRLLTGRKPKPFGPTVFEYVEAVSS